MNMGVMSRAEITLVSADFVFSLRDGIPPYRMGSKKQLQREMHRSVKANGQVSLPHFPVSMDGIDRWWCFLRS